jgi:CBS domain-containing protein
MVSLEMLKKATADGGEETLAKFVAPHGFPHLHVDRPLSLALERMGASHLDVLPVVSRGDIQRLEGIVTLQDVLNLYGLAGLRSRVDSVPPGRSCIFNITIALWACPLGCLAGVVVEVLRLPIG